ncbi:helix-turn-helix domain-containing protein [Symbioplanes lichenis]|uniref:helix-turn-helix domain-containing protein n=1 Tax=Symbioplanes lichenis TaxID=1629072 RepID=UPI002738EDF8|nr:helix-turn-helix domain-containing protein [Actinoplanes lichenis]
MIDADVGARLRALRKGRGLRLAEVAGLTGLATSTLSRLENGLMRPTLAQMVPLARAYDVSLDTLVGFAGKTERPPVIRRHGAEFHPLARQAGGIQAYKLVSPARTTLPAPDPRRHEGHQWVYVLSGRLRVVVGDRDVVLTRGEATEFDTALPHWMGHADHEPVELLVMYGPQGERARMIGLAGG